MAKTTRGQAVTSKVKQAGARARRAQLTLGDLIAAAFDTVGQEVRQVATVLSSPAMTVATGKQFVFVR